MRSKSEIVKTLHKIYDMAVKSTPAFNFDSIKQLL